MRTGVTMLEDNLAHFQISCDNSLDFSYHFLYHQKHQHLQEQNFGILTQIKTKDEYNNVLTRDKQGFTVGLNPRVCFFHANNFLFSTILVG